MEPEDAGPFMQRLVALGEVFDKSLSTSVQMLYFDALAHFDLAHVVVVLEQALQTCRFFPKPAELLALANQTTEQDAEAAWMLYKDTARRIGGYDSPHIPAVLAETIAAVFGSWEQACWLDLSPEMWASKRKEFSRAYDVIARRGIGGSGQIEGFIARENRLNGFASLASSAPKELL